MKLFSIILGLVTLAGVGMTAPAEARTHFSIGLGLGFFAAPRYVERVYVAPAPMYVAPAPIYEEVYYPAPRYYREVREVYIPARPCYYPCYYPY